MTQTDLAETWSQTFGLALAPLFENGEHAAPGVHHVLLDGGYGSFALSTSDEELWRSTDPAAWVWSSDIAHHITVTANKVAVVRWDKPGEPRVFGRDSVERGLRRFYDYLNDDRLRSNKTVVDHLLGLFRRIRSLSHTASLPDERAIEIFLATLAKLIAPDDALARPNSYGLTDDAFALQSRVSSTGLKAAIEEVKRATGSLSQLMLHPTLTIRHAAGQLFQEAHFELLRVPDSADLFGLVGVPEMIPYSRGGTHYTPPALARSIVEQTLGSLQDLTVRSHLTICDPACGSAAFLHEAIRALRRANFKGHLTIIGQDRSAAAIAMAAFVLGASLRDWQPSGGVKLELHTGDSLGDLGIPRADVILMNPPFIAFGSQDAEQREQLRTAVGQANAARGDYSMAFVIRALEALVPGGTMGTLFPASLLSLKAAESWRAQVAEIGNLRLLASIGDFGLFSHALVQIACVVVGKRDERREENEFTALVTENDIKATGEALRWLRKVGSSVPSQPIMETGWSIFPASAVALRERSTWRLPTPGSERILRALGEAQLPTIGDLFTVGQGVQTGLNEALLLTEEKWRSLPTKEQKYFKLATMTDSIQNGELVKPYRVFFPHASNGALFKSEDEVRSAAPNFFESYLEPHRTRLENRASIVSHNRSDWWGLMRPRSWSTQNVPRIISKFFGGEGAFFCDLHAQYIPVMGHIWQIKSDWTEVGEEDMLSLSELLSAYAALFNSEPFVRILSFYSPHVAGGQFDLSSRHVTPIPVPNLRELSADPERGRIVSELAFHGRGVNVRDLDWRARTAQLVAGLYGTPSLSRL